MADEVLAVEAVPLEDFETGRYDNFVGSMYTFTKGYPQSDVLKNNPDYLDYYLPIYETHARYYADAALQKILSEERMAVMYIQPDGTAGEEPDDEEEMEE